MEILVWLAQRLESQLPSDTAVVVLGLGAVVAGVVGSIRRVYMMRSDAAVLGLVVGVSVVANVVVFLAGGLLDAGHLDTLIVAVVFVAMSAVAEHQAVSKAAVPAMRTLATRGVRCRS